MLTRFSECFFAALLALLMQGVMAAPSQEQIERDLVGVQQNLKQERERLLELDAVRDAESDKLRLLENQQAEAARAAYEARFAAESKAAELAQLRARHTQLENEISAGLARLKDNLRALYALGSGHGLEGVLSPGGRADKMRAEGYLQHLRASRIEALQQLRNAREENARVQREIEFSLEELTRSQLLAETEESRLNGLRVEHAKLVASLDARFEASEARVKRMQRDQQALEQTLQRLEQAAREAEREAERAAEARRQEEAARQRAEAEQAKARQNEETRRAKLRESADEEDKPVVVSRAPAPPSPSPSPSPHSAERNEDDDKPSPADSGEIPVRGKKVRGFGDPTGVGDLRSRGVFYAAAEGARVRAVAEGKVVFADWVRGYGNLLIVQHKGGYMSLYAQNEALLKRQGSSVQRGEVVATAGRSGGERQTGVYVEVRRGGQPVNPARWSAWPKKS